jgi:uncharacterized protein YoxC
MARDTTEFAHQTGERAAQAATFGVTWAREFTEESFNQGKHALDSFLRVSRKMTEDLQSQMSAIREHTTALTEQTLSNTMEFGQKLARCKEPQDIAECQSEFMSRQAQAVADQTKVLGQKMQQAAQDFAQTASGAVNEVARRTADAPSLVGGVSSRAEQASKRQRTEA